MASNSNADVLMLFGVEGGGDIHVGSGKDIYADIKKIVEDIQDDITKQLKFEASVDSLKALRGQVEAALAEAVNSIKGTPVELTFSFDQKSVDAAFAKAKKEMKEQQITVSAQPKEKKETGKSGTPASTGNVSKEAAEAKQAIDEVGKEIESTAKEAEQALDNTIKKAEEATKKVVQTVQKIINVDPRNAAWNDLNKKRITLNELKTLQKYMNQRTMQGSDSRQGTDTDYQAWLWSNSKTTEGLVMPGHRETTADIGVSLKRLAELGYIRLGDIRNNNSREQEISSTTQDIYVDSFKKLKQDVNDLTEAIPKADAQVNIIKNDMRELANYFGVEYNDNGLELSLDQIIEAGKKFPELQPYLQRYIDILSSSDVQPALDSTEKEFDDVTESAKEATQAAVSTFDAIETRIEDITKAEKEAVKAFNISDYEYFPKSAELFKQVEMPTLPEIPATTADRLENEEEEARKDADAHKELNEELEKGITLRERTLRISSSISETPNGKIYTTTSRGLETGRIYTDTTKTVIDKDGIEQVIESFKFTNAQVNSALENAQTKVASLQKSMHSLYDISESKEFANSLQTSITSSINDVNDLISAISKAANHGYFGDLKELGFSDVKSAQDVLQEKIKNINSQISNSKKLIQDNNNTLQKSIGLLDSVDSKFGEIVSDITNIKVNDTTGIYSKIFEEDFEKVKSSFAVLSDTARQAIQAGDFQTFELVYQRMQDLVSETSNDVQRLNTYIKESKSDWDQTADAIRDARSQLTGLSETIGKNGSLTLSDKLGITTQTREELSKTIGHYQKLASLLLDISEISSPTEMENNLKALKKLGYDSVEEGYDALKLGIIEVDNQIKKTSKDVSDNEKYWTKNQEAVLKYADTLQKVSKETDKISSRDDDSASKNIQSNISELEGRANRLLTLLSQLSNATRKSDQTNAKNKLSKEFNVSTFEEGARLLTGYISEITDKTREANQSVADFNREWDKSANSVQRLQEKFIDINRNLGKLKDIDVDNVASKLHSDISQAAVEAEQLASALIEAANTGNTEHLQMLGYDSFEEGYRQLKIDLADIDDKMREANQAVSNAAKKATVDAEQEEKTFRKLDETLAKTDARILALKNDLSNLSTSQFDASSSAGSLNNEIADIEKLKKAIIEYKDKTDEAEKESFWAQKSILGVTNLTEAVDKLNTSLAATEAQMKKTQSDTSFITDSAAISAIEKYNKALRDFQNTKGASQRSDLFGLTYRDTNNLTMTKEQMESLVAETNRLTSATRELSEQHRREENVIIQRNKIYQEAANYYNKYQSGIRANIALNQKWQDTLKKLHDGGFGDNETARRALAELQTATKDANAETMTLWGSLKKLFTDHFGSVSATAFIGTLRNVLRGAYQNVLEIDKAMTELRKVTNLTEQQYESFQRRAADTAKEVGGSIADTINSTADFARLGYGIEDAESLSRAAMVYKNVGDGIQDISEASESIISTIKAFKDIDASDAMSIVDRFNKIGNEYAISSKGVGESLRRSAAALAAGGNDINSAIGLVVAGNTVIQDPDVVGGKDADFKSSYNG